MAVNKCVMCERKACVSFEGEEFCQGCWDYFEAMWEGRIDDNGDIIPRSDP